MEPPTSPPRQPQHAGASPRISNEEGHTKGKGPRNLMLNYDVPWDVKMTNAPRSPVTTVNLQSQDWPPRPSTAKIEGAPSFPLRVDSASNVADPNRRPSSDRPSTQHSMSHRPQYVVSSENLQQPQSAIISSSDGSPSPPESQSGENSSEEQVPQLQYFHHQARASEGSAGRMRAPAYNTHSSDNLDAGGSINRHLTPNSQFARYTPVQRPSSAYSDMGPRGRSPISNPYSPNWSHREVSSDSRPLSFIDLSNVSYPQAPPAAFSMDNSQLRGNVGSNASLLSSQKTLEMYRQNVKKSNDSETQYAFAMLLVQAAQEAGINYSEPTVARKNSPKPSRDLESPYIDSTPTSALELLREAKHLLQKLSDRSYPFAQYYLGDGYASGLFNKGKEDNASAFPLFVSASKHGHAEAGYRAALCYEFGWGCRKDPAKAVQFYRQSASKNHPGAMTRLGRACLSGDLGLNKYREGVKWLKRATESADHQYNAAPYHLALMYETGYGDDIFKDSKYAAELLTQAAELGHTEASFHLGEAYEHGNLELPQDPALSIHFYTGAAQSGHPGAMMALCAWFMIGVPPILEKNENEAYEWARQAAELGLTKAEYAVGYFTEMGIGCRRDPLEANVWYVKAADAGDDRAVHRLAAIRAAASGGKPMEVGPPRKGKKDGTDKDCIIM